MRECSAARNIIIALMPFDTEQYPGRLVFTGPRVVAPVNERPAFKDTIKALPGEVSRVIARFDLPSGTETAGARNSATSSTATSWSTRTMT
jgi:hypothetical protein